MRLRLVVLALVFCIALPAAAYEPDANAPRSSVPGEYTWDLRPLFSSDGVWRSTHEKAKKRLARFDRFQGKLGDPAMLAAALTEYFAISRLVDRVGLYAHLKNVQDTEVKRYERMEQEGIALKKDFGSETGFLRREVLALPQEQLDRLLADKRVAVYRDYLQDLLRRKSRLLGEEAEQVLSLAGDNLWAEIDLNELPSDVEMIFRAAMRDIALPTIRDEEGKEVQLTLSNYPKYRGSKDRRVRREAVEGFFAALKKNQHVLAAALAAETKRDVFFARARGYDRAIDAYLDREQVDPRVVDNLIRTINRNLKPLHRYVALRKKLLGVKKLHLYDLYTPLVPAATRELPYEEAVADAKRALAPLGEEYLAVAAKAMKPGSGWIDVYPNKHKQSGAFSVAIYDVHPFIKLNYQDEIDDAFTLVHEVGHTMHSWLNMRAQPYPTFGYSTFTAEIASTFNESLLSDSLLRKYEDDDELRLALLGERLEGIRTTIYRQALFAEFEQKIHEYAERGVPLTADLFNETYRKLIRRYYGNGFTMGADDDIEWAYIPHFYWKFYVFTYATGLSTGIALSEKVRDEGEHARMRYLAMLQEPSTADPVAILKKAGADLTKPGVIEAATDLMNRTITEMNRIIARRGKRARAQR